jgi:hypothetical protein
MPRTFTILSCLLVISVLTLTMHSGCLSTGGRLISTISPDVDRIPTTIGLFPILSSQAFRAVRRGDMVSSLSLSSGPDHIYIMPPTETELKVTSFSRMMTDLISMDLLYYGFDLRELPVEIPENGSADDDDDKTFSISLALLERLREEYGVKAIMIGNALFGGNPHATMGVEVHSAHVKIVDIRTLKVLSQVDFTFTDSGIDIENVCEEMAASLAEMAGIDIEERER